MPTPALKPRWDISPQLSEALSEDLDTSNLRPVDFLASRVSRLAQLLNRGFKESLATHFDLSLAEWRCLASLGDVGPLTAAQICRLTDSDKGQISIALRTLEEKGMTTVVHNVGKAVFLKLTRDGVRLFNRSVAMRKKEEHRLLALLSPQHRLALYEAIDILAVSFDDHSPRLD